MASPEMLLQYLMGNPELVRTLLAGLEGGRQRLLGGAPANLEQEIQAGSQVGAFGRMMGAPVANPQSPRVPGSYDFEQLTGRSNPAQPMADWLTEAGVENFLTPAGAVGTAGMVVPFQARQWETPRMAGKGRVLEFDKQAVMEKYPRNPREWPVSKDPVLGSLYDEMREMNRVGAARSARWFEAMYQIYARNMKLAGEKPLSRVRWGDADDDPLWKTWDAIELAAKKETKE